MTNPRMIDETHLTDKSGNKKPVRRGDLADLANSLSQRDMDFFNRWLGKGPYPISWIGVWPCGKVVLYLKTETSPGAGVRASELMYVGESD